MMAMRLVHRGVGEAHYSDHRTIKIAGKESDNTPKLHRHPSHPSWKRKRSWVPCTIAFFLLTILTVTSVMRRRDRFDWWLTSCSQYEESTAERCFPNIRAITRKVVTVDQLEPLPVMSQRLSLQDRSVGLRSARALNQLSFCVQNDIVKALETHYFPIHQRGNDKSQLILEPEEGPRFLSLYWGDGEFGGWGDRVKSYGAALMLAFLLDRCVGANCFVHVEFAVYGEVELRQLVFSILTAHTTNQEYADSQRGLYPYRDEFDRNPFLAYKWAPIGHSGGAFLGKSPFDTMTVEELKERYYEYTVVTVKNMFFPTCANIRNNRHFAEKLSRCEDWHGAAYKALMKPNQEFENRLQAFIRDHLGDQLPYFSIHLRVGAQWGDSQKNSEDDVHRFAQCARLVEDTFVNNVDERRRIKWFVATDNEKVFGPLSAFLHDRLVHATEGKIVHMGKSEDSQSKAVGLQRTLWDWYLLARSYSVVISPTSGFGKTASWSRARWPVSSYHYYNNHRSPLFLVCEQSEDRYTMLQHKQPVVPVLHRLNSWVEREGKSGLQTYDHIRNVLREKSPKQYEFLGLMIAFARDIHDNNGTISFRIPDEEEIETVELAVMQYEHVFISHKIQKQELVGSVSDWLAARQNHTVYTEDGRTLLQTNGNNVSSTVAGGRAGARTVDIMLGRLDGSSDTSETVRRFRRAVYQIERTELQRELTRRRAIVSDLEGELSILRSITQKLASRWYRHYAELVNYIDHFVESSSTGETE